MARLSAPERDALGHDEQIHYDRIVASRGKIAGPFTVLLHSPDLAARVADLGSYVRFEAQIPIACRCLAALLVARAFDCGFEWGGWAPQAEAAGVPVDLIAAIRRRERPADVPAELALVIAAGDGLLGPSHRLDERTYADIVAHFGVQGAVELAATFGYFAMLTFALNGFEVDPLPGAPRLDER